MVRDLSERHNCSKSIIYLMKRKLTSSFILLFLLILSANAQLAVGYNTDGNTLVLSYSPANRVWGEFRINTRDYSQSDWSHSDRGITQVYCLASLFKANGIVFYAGGGAGVNLLSTDNEKWVSINVPVGLKLNPFSKFPGLYLFGEYDPMFVVEEDIPIIHSISAGFRILLTNND